MDLVAVIIFIATYAGGVAWFVLTCMAPDADDWPRPLRVVVYSVLFCLSGTVLYLVMADHTMDAGDKIVGGGLLLVAAVAQAMTVAGKMGR